VNPLSAYLAVAVALFGVGLYGLVQRRSLVAMLIALELMLASVSIIVVAVTVMTGSDASLGQVIALILVGVAASEAAIALSLFVAIHRTTHAIDVERLSELKG
jgi:NADH:ubiquinone oxidoreductase subunit K